MNKRSIFFIIIVLSSLNPLFAWNKRNASQMIDKASSIISSMDQNAELKEYYPYDLYSESINDITKSQVQMDDSNYEAAYYFASVAIIKLEATMIFAESRKLRQAKLIHEKNYYKQKASKVVKIKPGSSPTRYLIEANLTQKGNFYRIELLDKYLFKRRTHKFINKGSASLNKIVRVLRAYPESTIKIIGHTGKYDLQKYSARKARAVSEFFINADIAEKRVDFAGIGNKVVMDTPLGFRRVDRVEIIISNIDLGKPPAEEPGQDE
ncbi:MAG: OmpA family protein [bacterium]|nr:OmpA family protein [bacterium]